MFNRVAVKAVVVLALSLAALARGADQSRANGMICSTCMSVDRCMFNYAQECAMLCGPSDQAACAYDEECPSLTRLWCITGDQ